MFMNDKLDRYIESVQNLPARPTAMVSFVAIIQKPDHDVDDVVNLIRRDPSLTAEVLRHSNSAYFGNDEPIVDVFDAITRLGFYEVYKAAMAKLGSQSMQAPAGASSADVEKLWRHSSIAAVTSGAIARKAGENEGLAFTAGLLHDVGKIVLASAEGGRYDVLKQEAGDRGAALEEAEAMMFGFGHAEVGARLLSKWELPREIFVPVQHHHQVRWDEPIRRICAVISLGNLMAHAAEAGGKEKPYESPEAVAAMRVLQLTEDNLVTMLKDAESDIEAMTSLMGAAAK